MSANSCRVRNLAKEALSGFSNEKDALSAGAAPLSPGPDGWLDASGRTALCVVCENCGSVVTDAPGSGELECPDCGEDLFRVFRTFRYEPIERGFGILWEHRGISVKIEVPESVARRMSSIRYTVDGSEPTLSSPVYAGPVGYRKSHMPMRAAVYFPDARSQTIEWDYGRAERNRSEIRKTSTRSAHPASKMPPPPPPSPPPRPAPKPEPEEERPREKNIGCGVAFFIALGLIGWANDIRWLWILAIFGLIGVFQDDD